jgi:hypothetical protein
VAAATDSAATKLATKQTIPTRDAPRRVTPKRSAVHKRVRHATVVRAAKRPRHISPAPLSRTEPSISAVEPLGESESFVMGESTLS